MKALTTFLLSILFVLSVAAAPVQVSVQRAEIDDTEIRDSQRNILDIERNQDFTLELQLLALKDAKDVEIRAFISGYEFNDVKSISDQVGLFDFDENVTYVKKLQLSLPDNVDVDDYKLRVVISDRNGDETVYNYNLQVNTQRHDMQVEDIVLNPGNSVKAGQALLASVRLENKGQKDEDDVKVTVSIPALGVSATEYIEEVEADEEEETEEIFLKLPKCAEAGVYDLNVDVWFNDDHDKVSESTKVTVLENEACTPEPAPVIVVQQSNQTSTEASEPSGSKVRSALEIILLVLVALLVIVGLIIGFSRMRGEE